MLLTLAQAADVLGVSVRVVRSFTTCGLPYIKLPNGRVRIDVYDLERFVQTNKRIAPTSRSSAPKAHLPSAPTVFPSARLGTGSGHLHD